MARRTINLDIRGMTCGRCADAISDYLKKEEGVLKTAIRWGRGKARVTFDPEVTSVERILASRAFQGNFIATLGR